MNPKFAIAILAIILIIGGVTVMIAVNQQDEGGSLTRLLIDFCWEQLPDEDDCAQWALDFNRVYGEEARECLESFDSGSALLGVCLVNVVEGH
jgi:hypothetical protein